MKVWLFLLTIFIGSCTSNPPPKGSSPMDSVEIPSNQGPIAQSRIRSPSPTPEPESTPLDQGVERQ